MKISLNNIRKVNQIYNSAGDPAPDGVTALVEKIGAQLGAVEEVVDFGNRFEEVIIVKVVKCEKHPNADKLSLCLVDDGGINKDEQRDSDGMIQIVCGADNVHSGMLAAWLPPGSTVPNTIGKDPFILDAREIRGVKSNGMLASAKELGIGDDHSGILEVDKEVEPGTSFIDAYNLADEFIIDIENKMFTHRPDCFGFLGVAREIEGISHRQYKSPDWYQVDPEIPGIVGDQLPLEVINELPELVPRFCAIAIKDVTIKQSPVWLRIFLSSIGIKPVNNIVDYTNFFMLETGQPIHAYDYDKVKELTEGDVARLTVRHPRGNEKIKILNGKTIEPRKEAMMVAADKALVCVGGAIGGLNSEVDENTTNIIIEAATWDMYNIRSTAMEHGIFTDAVTRFTKGQSPLQNKAVVAKIVDEIRQYADGKVASEFIDINHVGEEVKTSHSIYPPVSVNKGYINSRLGLDLSAEEMSELLKNVEFDVQLNGDELTVKAPFWRTDIEIKEDVIEEVGRLYGYDHLPIELPTRPISPVDRNEMLDFKSKLRRELSKAGANEVLTYSFVHGNVIEKAGQDIDKAYRLSNAISPDLQYYRISMLPSLLDKIQQNVKSGFYELAIFEIGKVHIKGFLNEENLPKEFERLALVFSAEGRAAGNYGGASYFAARNYLMNLLSKLVGSSDQIKFEPLSADDSDTAASYFLENRAATIWLGNVKLGRIGEFKHSVRKAFKLPEFTSGFEISLGVLKEKVLSKPVYFPLSRFPGVEQDISLKLPADVAYQNLYDEISKTLSNLKPEDTVFTISPLDIYQSDNEPSRKHIAFRLKIVSYVKTLKAEEVNKLLDEAAAMAKDRFGAERL